MATTFIKDPNGKVLVNRNGVKYSLSGGMNIIPHPVDTEIVIITDSSAPLEQREVLKFSWQEVTLPVVIDRNDLIEKLGKNFFYDSVEINNDNTNPIPVVGTFDFLGSLAGVYSVAASSSSVVVLAQNVTRKEAIIRNDSDKKMYLSSINPATLNSAIEVFPNEIIYWDKNKRELYAIWEVGVNGFARIEEVYS